jgi:hypothetical protein
MIKKKIWAKYQRIIEVLTQKIFTTGIRNPGSGKNLSRIPDPEVKKAPDPGSRFRIPDPGSGSATLFF